MTESKSSTRALKSALATIEKLNTQNPVYLPLSTGTLNFCTIPNLPITLGLNLKGLMGAPVKNKHWGSPVIGVDIALPITFRFGHLRHWDFRMEPFNLYLHGQKTHRDYLGFRNTVGYRF